MTSLNTPVPPATFQAAFAARGCIYSLEQVISAADFRGELASFRPRCRDRILRAALAAERGSEPDEAVLEEAAATYRYERALTTAEDCEQWLAARGLTLEDFQEHFARSYWEQHPKEEAVEEPETDPEERARLFRVDLLLSNEFDGLAHRLAWRVALGCEQGPSPAEASRRPGRAAIAKPGGLLVPLDPEWLAELQRLETAFAEQSERLLIPPNRQRWLANLRSPLVRADLEILEVDTEAAAREAILCVEQDGMSLSEVAVQGGFSSRQISTLAEDLPLEWQQRILSASPRTVLPPLPAGCGFQVCHLKSKQEPSLDDPAVRERVDAAILRQYFMDLETRHVRWQISVAPCA